MSSIFRAVLHLSPFVKHPSHRTSLLFPSSESPPSTRTVMQSIATMSRVLDRGSGREPMTAGSVQPPHTRRPGATFTSFTSPYTSFLHVAIRCLRARLLPLPLRHRDVKRMASSDLCGSMLLPQRSRFAPCLATSVISKFPTFLRSRFQVALLSALEGDLKFHRGQKSTTSSFGSYANKAIFPFVARRPLVALLSNPGRY